MMAPLLPYPIHTISETAKQISQGEDPWFYSSQPSQHDWLRTTTPEPFQRRNIFVERNVLDNKYELQQMFGAKPRWTLWSEQELQHLSASNESINVEII